MQCQHAYELFSDYLSGETDRALTVSLENHLATCERCSEELSGLRRVWGALEELPVLDPPMYFHENIMSRLDQESARQEQRSAQKKAIWDWRNLFRPRSLAYAAALLVFLLAGAHLTQRAELDPIENIIRMFRTGSHSEVPTATAPAILSPRYHPEVPSSTAPTVLPPRVESVIALQTARIEWIPNGSGAGVLGIHLRAAEATGGTNNLTYQIFLPGHKSPDAKGVVSSDRETLITLPLTESPSSATASLVVAISPEGDTGTVHQKMVTLPMAQAPVAP